MKHNYLLCPYDGFKLRIYLNSYILYVLLNTEKYKLVTKIPYEVLKKLQDALGSKEQFDDAEIIYPIAGEYEGFTIQIAKDRIGLHVEIAGSFHKYFYHGENFKPFYWKDFIKVFNEFKNLFALDADVVRVVGLEVGVNVPTLLKWLASARKICGNILFFNPPSKKSAKDIKEYQGFGYSWCTFHDEYWIKIYDKLPKFQEKVDDIIRLEKKHIKKKPLQKRGVFCLSDLLNEEVLIKLNKDLLKSLDKLIIYQTELDYVKDLTEDDKTFLLQYKKAEAWDVAYAYKEKKGLFKRVKSRYNELVEKHCSFNLKEEILKEVKGLLDQRE